MLHGHVPDAFCGNGKQQDVDSVDEGSVGELGPHSGDVRRKLMIFQLVNAPKVLVKVVAKFLRAAP